MTTFQDFAASNLSQGVGIWVIGLGCTILLFVVLTAWDAHDARRQTATFTDLADRAARRGGGES